MATSIGFEIYAKDTASAKFDALGNKIDGTSGKFTKIGQAAKVAGLAMVAGIGVATVALVGMTKSAIEDEAAQQKLALGLKNATNATDGQVAAAEKWITAQGNALGVTDDELRPALQKLAQTTGDVGKAQQQLQIAMDISAGSGKSLKSVTEAMMKANNGSVTSLGKLGFATKSAAGETLTMDQIMGNAANTFGGQAAAKADTLAGKMDILKLRFDEAKETIGAKLIPVLTRLSDWVLATGVPAIEKFVQQWKDGEGAGGRFAAVLTTVKDAAVGTVSFLMEHKNAVAGIAAAYGAFKVAQLGMAAAEAASLLILKAHTVGTVTHTVVSTAAAAASKTWAAGQWLLNAALTANPIGLVIVAVAAMVAGFVIAWKKSETFREVILGSWNAIKNATGNVWDWIKTKVGNVIDAVTNVFLNFTGPGLIIKHWDTIRAVTSTAWEAVRDLVTNKLGAVRDAVSGIGGAVRDRVAGAWDAVREKTSDAWTAVVEMVATKIINVMEKVGTIKERVLGVLSGASTWLTNAGSELIQGLINGITAKLGALTSKMSEVANKIKGFLPGSPVKTGPLTSWNNGGAGKRLVGLLADGLSDTGPVDAAMRNLAGHANLAGEGSMTVAGSSLGGGGSASFGGGGGGVVYNVTFNGITEPNEVVAAFHTYVKRNGPVRGLTA